MEVFTGVGARQSETVEEQFESRILKNLQDCGGDGGPNDSGRATRLFQSKVSAPGLDIPALKSLDARALQKLGVYGASNGRILKAIRDAANDSDG